MSTCFFAGHREAPLNIMPLLEDAVERHIIDYGVKEFIIGRYGSFDRMAAKAVANAQKRHGDISYQLLLPYYRPEKALPDNAFYPPGIESVPRRFAIPYANKYMVDHSDYLIAYVSYAGYSRDLVMYARKREKKGLIRVENLAEKAL